jgi:mono/diheme cytochrome c family protein
VALVHHREFRIAATVLAVAATCMAAALGCAPTPPQSPDAQVFSSIAQGRAHGMPAWDSTLTDDQIWQLVAYIKSLGSSLEIEPPS